MGFARPETPTTTEPRPRPRRARPRTARKARPLVGLHQLPNTICVLRVAVIFAGLYALGQQYQRDGTWNLTWLGAMVVAALTDRLDGFLAKRYGWTSTLGAFLDQISDKLVTLGIYAFLAIHGAFHLLALGAIVLRELYVSALRISANEVSVPIRTGQAGRFKTFVQQVAALFIFLHWAFPKVTWHGYTVSQWVVWSGFAVFLLIALAYGRRTVRTFVRVYTLVRTDAQGREHKSYVDLALVVLTLAAIPVSALVLTRGGWYGTLPVLTITLGTGWTYLAGFRFGARTAGVRWRWPALFALASSLTVTAGLVLVLEAAPTYGFFWLMVGGVSLLWTVLLVASWYTGSVYLRK